MRLDELIIRDELVSNQIAQTANGRFLHTLAWIIARSGDSLFWLIFSVILLWQKQPLGWDLLLTMAVAAGVTAVAKGVFKRKRPSEKWAISTDKYSFPSGHAARAGAVAITLTFAFPVWGWVSLLWAVFVGLARVALARHFLSDVTVGLILGIVLGLILQIWIKLLL